MKIDWKQLKSLSVETKSGVNLGKILNFILETDGQSILQYEVGSLFGKKYLISREQVLSVDNEKILVEDNVEGVGSSRDLAELKSEKIDMEPVAMRESE